MSDVAINPPARSRQGLVSDFIAGLATGVADIPDAMASAILAGANPVQGLYAIMIGTPLGAICGRSAFMTVATTSAVAITAGSALASFSDEQHATGLAALGLLAGLIMVVAGWLRAGRLLRFVSNSVVIGFLTGVSERVKGQLDRTGTTQMALGEDGVFLATQTLGAASKQALAAATRTRRPLTRRASRPCGR